MTSAYNLKKNSVLLSSDLQCKNGMYLHFRIKFCVILQKSPRCYKRQANFTFVLLSEKQNWYCGLKNKTKTPTQVTPQVKQKPLDHDCIQDTIQELPWDSNTSIIFNLCQDNFISLHHVHWNNNKNMSQVLKKNIKMELIQEYLHLLQPTSFYHTMLTSACRSKSLSRWCQNTLQRLLA